MTLLHFAARDYVSAVYAVVMCSYVRLHICIINFIEIFGVRKV